MAQQDRFLALLSLATETVRTEEATLRTIARAGRNPDHLISSYIQSRRQWYELMESMLGYTNESEDEEPLPRIQIQIPANWEEPIAVVPSNQQIGEAMREMDTNADLGTCAICQDTIEEASHGCQLRNCGHHFHDSCIMQWFTHSVRCPVCRNDIREPE